MRHNAPWNIKNESNNLLHGSVVKLANHFMIWARRLFSTNLNSVEKTNDNKKNRMKNVDNVGKKNGLTFVCANSYRVLGVHYLCCGIVT